MTEPSLAAFMELAARRSGHFAMESGLHSALWLDLDALFASPTHIDPFIASLADRLRPFRLDAVCGPLLGGAFLAQRIASLVGAEFWFTEPVAPAPGSELFRARYRLPAVFRGRLSRPRLALVDDVISAASSLRASHAEVRPHSDVIVVGTLLQLGSAGATFFADLNTPVTAVLQQPFETWAPADCPHCAAGTPLERVTTAA